MPANYVLLATQTVGNGGAASVSFENIPPTGYTDLKVVISARGTGSLVYDTTKVTFNGTTSGYSTRYLQGSGSAASSGTSGASTYIELIDEGGNATASTFSNTEIIIPNYTSSANKSVSSDQATETNATTVYSRLTAGLWSNSAAITKITFTPDASSAYAAGSTFYLYGLAAVGTTPVLAPFASGGDVIANDGTYWYHAFKSSGAFVPAKALSCDVLVVAGGGGGGSAGGAGYNGGAGGGAGGLRVLTSQSLTSSVSYTCTIGAGGTTALSTVSTAGTNSSFAGSGISTISVTGGGFGGRNGAADKNGGNGGSGGGAGATSAVAGTAGTGNAGSYSPVEGYNGGAGSSNGTSYDAGGGGGGAGAVGGAGSSGSCGAGGAGANAYNGTTFTNWLTAAAVGSGGYLAGGGGGGGVGSATAGSAGSGGGGAGSNGGTPGNGVANTGSGGGGAGTGAGGQGGSGIVIIRYAMV